MTLLDTHLEQISLCATSIRDLPFPPPKIFTNALLHPHDITALIRDTELHERALFSVPTADSAAATSSSKPSADRRETAWQSASMSGGQLGKSLGPRAPRRNTAVAAVLGGDLFERIQRESGGAGATTSGYGNYRPYNKEKQDVDVELLLEGAEKLCNVYPVQGAAEKIRALRQRHKRLVGSIEHYELKVAEQQTQLSRMNRSRSFGAEDDDAGDAEAEPVEQPVAMTASDLAREEEEIMELQRKKLVMEDRVNSMGRDISGVLR